MSRTAGLALAIAMLAPAAAVAQDYGGGIKDYRSGVPVPAPVPVYEHFRWYLRADVGGGFTNKSSVRESGAGFGVWPAAKGAWGISADGQTHNLDSSGFRSDFDTFLGGGLGVGMYLTPRLRGDITVDSHTKSEIGYNGGHTYAEAAVPLIPVGLVGPPWQTTGNFIRGTTTEHSDIHNTTALVNLYYDLRDRGGFSPYVGIGGGFAVRQVERRHSTLEERVDPAGLPVIRDNMTGEVFTRNFVTTTKTNNVVGALALTAGTSYALSPGMLVDFSYRYTWLGGVDASMQIGNSNSRLIIGDAHDHALRAGLRWNVW